MRAPRDVRCGHVVVGVVVVGVALQSISKPSDANRAIAHHSSQRLHVCHHIAHNARPEELSTLWILSHDHGDPNDLCSFTLLSIEATMVPIGVR